MTPIQQRRHGTPEILRLRGATCAGSGSRRSRHGPARPGEWKEGKWHNSFGEKIDGLFEVLSWWPIPPENVLIDEVKDAKP